MEKQLAPAMLSDKRRTLIFTNILVTSIASSMLITALTAALPVMVVDLTIPLTSGHWLTSGYSLVTGIIMPLTAFLLTRFPTKNLYFIGLSISIVGLFFCAVAPSFPLLMCARAFQACGSGVVSSMGQVVLLTIYPPERRGTVMGWYGLSMGAAPAIAPILAGIIVDTLGWRAIFYFALAILSFSLLLALTSFDNVLPISKKSFDSFSFVLSATAFGCITLGIGNISSYGITSPRAWAVLGVGGVSAGLFIYRQLHLAHPLLELRVFADRSFTISVIGSALIYFVMMGMTILLPVYIQSICGHSATLSGFIRMPGSLLMAVTSLFAGKLYDRAGIKKVFVVGAAAMLISNVAFALVAIDTAIWLITSINLLYNLSIGCLLMPLVTWGLQGIANTLTAHGSALMNTVRTVVGSIGTTVFIGVMAAAASLAPAASDVNSQLYGFRVACLAMLPFTAALLFTAVFYVKSPKRTN